MARINIEENLWKSDEFLALVEKIGRVQAIGALVIVWKEAQIYFLNGMERVPTERIEKLPFAHEIIESGFADVNEHGVYLKGSKDQFAWLLQRQTAGRKKKRKTGKRNGTGSNGTERAGTSLLFSPSSLLSNTGSFKECANAERDEEADEGSPVNRVIQAYCDAYKAHPRYRAYPEIRGKDAGIAKRLVKDLGEKKASAMVEVYLRMTDSFFLTRAHDLPTFEANLNKVKVFMETGNTVSAAQARNIEARDQNNQVARQYYERTKGEMGP